VDAAPPAPPALVSKANGVAGKHPAHVEVSGEPDGHFECGLDGGIWKTCGSLQEYDSLSEGEHSLLVRQVDSAGNAGPATLVSFDVSSPDTGGQPRQDGGTPTRVDAVTPPAIAVDGGTVAVGCRLDAGTLARCEVRAYVTVTQNGKRKRVLVGQGRTPKRVEQGGGSTTSGGGAREATVLVKLNGRGRQVACNAGGARVTFDVRAFARQGGSVRTSTSARVRTPRLIVVPSDGMFGSGRVDLMPRGVRSLLKIAHRLKAVPAIRCTGHTDSDGGAAYNSALGLARARTTCRFLRRHGVRSHMRMSSAGESRPRATNRTARGRARNRRVDISITCDGGRSGRRH
jgi:outer membrane protein OmpA-like peptidoglycan-associated protein